MSVRLSVQGTAARRLVVLLGFLPIEYDPGCDAANGKDGCDNDQSDCPTGKGIAFLIGLNKFLIIIRIFCVHLSAILACPSCKHKLPFFCIHKRMLIILMLFCGVCYSKSLTAVETKKLVIASFCAGREHPINFLFYNTRAKKAAIFFIFLSMEIFLFSFNLLHNAMIFHEEVRY